MTGHAELKEMLGLHALDALGASDAAELRAHLATCGGCRVELALLRDVAAQLAHAVMPVEPSDDVTRRILEAVEHRPRRPWRLVPVAAGIAAAAAIAILVVANVSLLRRIDRADHMLAQGRGLLEFLASPDVSTVSLAATELAPQARAIVAYSRRSGRIVLLAFGLPAPPEGEAYQLWRIAEGIRPGLVFSTDARGGAFVDAAWSGEAGRAPLFAITREPSRGVPDPTGPLLLLGPR